LGRNNLLNDLSAAQVRANIQVCARLADAVSNADHVFKAPS